MGTTAEQFTRLKALLRRRGQTPENAEDLVQEAFLRLHEFLGTGHEVQKPEAFLTRTAFNLAVDASRKEPRDRFAPEPVEDLPLVDLDPTPEERLATQQRLAQARDVLQRRVSARTREAFLLHRVEGLKHPEIAARMGISVSAVEKHIARAVLALMQVPRRP